MATYFRFNYNCEPFELFGATHFYAILVIVGLFVLQFFQRKPFTLKQNRNYRIALSTILLLNEIGWHCWNYFTG